METRASGHQELDVADESAVLRALEGFGPSVVIHAAAYTDTAGCEGDPPRAFLVNGQGTRNVASACRRLGVPLVYISSNEVFDGRKGRPAEPYSEEDEPGPINVYGRSKLQGERHVQDLLADFYIVRTAWLYAHGGENFPAKVLRAAANGHPLRMVTDEVASPTWARELAQAIVKLLLYPTRPGQGSHAVGWPVPRHRPSAPYGIYHLTNGGSCSRYEWALKLLELLGLSVPVEAVTQDQFGHPSRKPAYSELANTRAASLGIVLSPWEEALARSLAEGENANSVGGVSAEAQARAAQQARPSPGAA